METFIFVRGKQVAHFMQAKAVLPGETIYLDNNTKLCVLSVETDEEANSQMINAEPM